VCTKAVQGVQGEKTTKKTANKKKLTINVVPEKKGRIATEGERKSGR